MRSISNELLKKLNSMEQTRANDNEPHMSIQVSRARTSVMDSTYWTVEDIADSDSGDLGEVVVAPRRYLKHYGRPDGIFALSIQDGIAKTLFREYPDYQKIGWQYKFDVGQASHVAIAFDGSYEYYRNKTWRYKTQEYPWIFWVDIQGTLWGQYWDNKSTRIELSTGVSNVSAIRGWNNSNILGNDQGLIVAYIKNNRPFYRTYAYQDDGSRLFESEVEITEFEGNAVNINLFITNDYRTGILIEADNSDIYWLITERNWAGLALGFEKLQATAKAKAIMRKVNYTDVKSIDHIEMNALVNQRMLFASSYNELIAINYKNNDDNWGYIINLEFKNPVEQISLENVKVTDIYAASDIPIKSLEVIDKYNVILEVNEEVLEIGINNTYENIRVTISNTLNEAGYTFDEFQTIFKPINLVPVEIPLPEVLEVWNE